MYDKQAGERVWYTVVPSSDCKTIEYAGKTHKMSMRWYTLSMYHLSPMSGHRGRDATCRAIMDSGLWWSSLWNDCDKFIKACIECRKTRAKPHITGHVRSREYDGPFRYLIIYFVGPQRPPTARGNVYMLKHVD